MTDPRPHPTTWTAPDRLPSRHELQPASLPADLEALVRSGHLTEVEPGRYRRAPRRPTAPPATPTPREQYDRHADCIAAAVLDRAADAALAAHVAARALLDRHLGPRPAQAGTVVHSNRTPAATTPAPSTAPSTTPTASTTPTSTAPATQQPLDRQPTRQGTQATRPARSPYGTDGVGTVAAQSRPGDRRTGTAVSVQHAPSGGLPQDAVPQDDRRCARRTSPAPPLPLAEASPPRDLALAGVRPIAAQAISALTTDCARSAPAVNSRSVGPVPGLPTGCR